jgi:hypothetical protein
MDCAIISELPTAKADFVLTTDSASLTQPYIACTLRPFSLIRLPLEAVESLEGRNVFKEFEMVTLEQKTESFIRRFWAHVKVGNPDECWNWTGHIGKGRYGHIRKYGRNGQMIVASRASWVINFGEIPEGLEVLHKCDNTRCVNPGHLFLGTQLDNVQDMIAKGRDNKARGDRNPNAKLNIESVKTIRAMFSTGITRKEIATKFNVSYSLIKQIIRREGWKYVE